MIISFTGTPGSGKTYEAVKKILNNLKKSRVVFTNIEGMDSPECLEMIKNVTGMNDCGLARHLFFLDQDQLDDFWNHVVPGSLVVLDEVQNIFSARDWRSEKNISFNSWSSTHRHHGYDVVLITQHIQRVDTAVRALVEWSYVFRKVNFFGAAVKKKYMCYSYGGEDVNGTPLAKSVRTYRDIVFYCYKSYVAEDVKELGIMKHVNVLKHPVFFAIPVLFVIFIYMLSQSGMIRGDFFGSNKSAAHAKKITGKARAASAPEKTPYSDHTPNIYRTFSRSGQIMFTNRIKNNNNEPSNDRKRK